MPYMKGSMMINLLTNMSSDQLFYKMAFVSYTSYNQPDKIDYIKNSGADEIINKPVKYQDFKVVINDVINLYQADTRQKVSVIVNFQY